MPVSKAKTAPVAKNGWDEKTEAALQARYEKEGSPSDTAVLTAIGADFGGKSAAAIRGKLVSMGIYQKGEPKAVGGASSTRKIEIVNSIEILLSKPKGSFASLEKASKAELDTLAAALVALSDNKAANTQAAE